MNVAPAPAAHGQPPVAHQLVDNLWVIFAHNINSGAASFIEMPITLKTTVQDKGLEILALRFRNLIQAPVTIFEDHDRAIIQIMPSRHDNGHAEITPGARDPKVKNTKKAKVARPANAFILYRQHHHPLLKIQNPDLHNNQISIILGAQWKKESESTKARFSAMAKQLKAKHQAEHPDYQYQPRKPSEKKRRMTQRKKAALAQASHPEPNSSLDPSTTLSGASSAAHNFSAPVPKLPKTVGGNAMIELGNEDLDEQTLTAMLEQYNTTVPQISNNLTRTLVQASPPIIYGEPCEEAQEQKNFYSNFHPFSTNESLVAEMEALSQVHAPENYMIEPELDENYLFNAELNRMCRWNEEPIFSHT